MKKKVYNPVSVYRLQFYKGFNFKDAEIIVTYLNSLGIRTVYASPIFQAVKGSMHGYDVTDPLSINSEIGNIDSFDQLIKELHDRNMGWLQDFVPNHMAYSTENPWIFDLLQRGKQSDFYSFFDLIDNHPDEELRDKIMLPFFGEAIDQVIKDGELVLEFDERGFMLNYFENQYPVSYRAYPGLAKLVSGIEMPGILKEIFQSTAHPDLSDEDLVKIYNSYKEKEDVYAFISKCISEVNSDPLKMIVLSDIPGRWRKITKHWKSINTVLKPVIGSQPVPSSNDEYFIYQTLCAHLPMDGKIDKDFNSRLEQYLVKAFREAKVNSSWSDPDTEYENKTLEFLIAEYSRDAAALADRLWQNSTNGSVKQWISYLTLQERANNPDLFLKGSYQVLQVKGAFEKHIISFMRRYRDECLLIVLPLSTAALSEDHDWKDTRVILPDISPPEWENRFTKEVFQTSNKVYVKDIFTKFHSVC